MVGRVGTSVLCYSGVLLELDYGMLDSLVGIGVVCIEFSGRPNAFWDGFKNSLTLLFVISEHLVPYLLFKFTNPPF